MREDERRFGGEVARTGRVDRVLGGSVESQLGGDRLGVEPERRARQRAGTVRRHRRPLVEVPQTLDVTQQRMRVREQMVREQHRLRRLQVRLARHHGVGVRGGLVCDGVDDVEHTVADTPRRVAQPHAEQRRHLVVAGAPGAQTSADLGADPLDQTALECAVHVLVGLRRARTRPMRHRRRGRSSPSSMVARSSSLSSPARCRTLACAWDARTS